MSTYTVSNLSSSTSKQEQDKLTAAVNKLPGVKGSKLSTERKELSFECSGAAPSFDAIKGAGKGCGFQIEQNQTGDKAAGQKTHEQKPADHRNK